jgi:hypothetical protein
VLKKRKVEAHGDFILGPVLPKEYKETVAELNGSRTNRVFEFFKVAAPERIDFAKHHEAAERKAAALAATDADAGETATSPRAAPTKRTGRKNIPAAAATATAEERARKKRGGRSADSPPAAKRTRVVDVETGVVEDVITVVPLRSAAPSVRADEEAGGPLLVPLSPKEKDSDDDSDVRIVSSIGEAPRGRSPTAFGPEAARDDWKSSSASTSSSSSSSESTEQSASPSATGAEKDDFVVAAEENEEEEGEPDSSNYRVTPEEPQATAARLRVPAEAKLIGEKQIRFLGLTSGGHERKFLEEAGSSFAIPHKEEYFGNLSSADLTTACGDLSLKAFIASRCLARRLEQESKKAKEMSVAATTSLQSCVGELEGRLAAEQERNRQLLQVKEDEAKASQAALETLRLDMENLANTKEDLSAQLRDKNAKLAEAQNKMSQLSSVLERYRAEHIRSVETLRSEVLELIGQCNLDAPPTAFPQCTVGAFYECVSACFDLITMNTKIFGELGAAVGVRTLAYSVCSLILADRPSSEKTVSKSDLQWLTKDDFGWPTDAELDVAQLPVLAKNLAKNFMNTFFVERGSRLTLDESVRLSAQVRRSSFHFCSNTPILVPTPDDAIMLSLMLCG